ncbi:MAG: gamma-glutamyltransferase, partial [Chitinophagaceae bacterium]|nr:gamma-glutamyltransferase [Chitinophagaceae bacterium]
AVVSAHPLASKIGVDVMKKGGNAFDAAIATQFALAVVYPGAGNIGGGGFMVARTHSGQLLSLDYREAAPATAQKDMYLDSSGNIIEGKSTRGPGSSGVPGSVAGIFETLKYARLNIADLINPAIDLAENGFAITGGEASSLNSLKNQFAQYNTATTAFQKADPWKSGDTLIQKDLASTLKRIRDEGAKGFYEGVTAQLMVEEMKNGGGYISEEDLKSYQAKWREPHSFNYRDFTVVSMGLPSSGGILLHQMLGMLEKRPIATYGCLSPNAVQLMVEVERRAYADRAEYPGDPDFIKVPVPELTSEKYLDERMKNYAPGIAGKSVDIQAGHIAKESEETTHISIIDNEGNAVAVTTTLNDSYGSKTVVAGAGFLLNNEMDDFSVKPGAPNLYGAIGGEANAIAPHKRMLSSMSPTILLQDGKPVLVVGTPGGTTIPTSVFQTIVNIFDFNLKTSDAVNYPKFHHQWLPDKIYVEQNFPDSTRLSLEKMGYEVDTRGAIGRTEVIRILPNGELEAVADGRGDDSAEGY